jgi:UDP-glucuronate decarboxylase
MAGTDAALAIEPPPPTSPERRRPDLSTLRSLLGQWRPTTLADGLRRTFDWYAAQLAPIP